MSSTSIVFGGAGFIGTHLLRHLSEKGSDRLVAVDYKGAKNPVPGVTYVKTDVKDLSQLDVPGEIGTIYNLAAIHTTPGHPPHEYYETNVLGALEITSFARRRNVSDIVFTSSISVYGPGEDTKSEDVPVEPTSHYGRSKYLAERIHRTWLEEDAARRLVICRPAVVFGPGEGGNFTRLAKLLKKGVFVYPGRKDTIKACIYVEDLVFAIESVHARREPLVIFNGCYPDRYSIEDIVEAFRSSSFPKAKTYLMPYSALKTAANVIRPFSVLGLGIHPERIEKLVKSTDVVPGWLQAHGLAKANCLGSGIERWRVATNGAFD